MLANIIVAKMEEVPFLWGREKEGFLETPEAILYINIYNKMDRL